MRAAPPGENVEHSMFITLIVGGCKTAAGRLQGDGKTARRSFIKLKLEFAATSMGERSD